ncbi:pleckstrin homology domain-containing family G member 7 isoform X1 [Bufo gargarizans]|uniref:pleckstrin homology domain-containing family G member 7 isoform X1 n=1 Tax=Bufo gargarizans TaxID=30331 RepID=UPI001CF28A58|nr:pleckstrin homology domain-containing family G member 7 isoform X1 [Bufo gargarizans]
MLAPVRICFQDMDEEEILIAEYTNEDNEVEVFDVNLSSPSDSDTKSEELSQNTLNEEPHAKDEQLITDTALEKRPKKANIPPLILMEIGDGSYTTPFQFDRQALGRISTSPTLRRLRKSTVGNFTPLQDVFDVSKFPVHKEECIGDNESCVSQNLEDHVKTYDHLDPALHTNYTDDEKSPEHKCNGATTAETKGGPEITNYCAQMKAFQQSQQSERRRSSVVLSIPGLEVFPGDLLVSDGASDYMYHAPWLPQSDVKKPKWPFSKKASFIKGKQKQTPDLENCLLTFKVPDFTEYEFYNIKDKIWDEFRDMQTNETKQMISSSNRKRQASIWELFTSECTYFLEHLLVLKMIFVNALKHLQNNDHLLDVDPARLFANLEELNQESLNFAQSLFNTIKSRELGSTTTFSLPLADLLTKYFKDNLCLSHQIYCLNYTSAIIYLETLKQREDFAAYSKWCEQQEQCRRLHLTDLLVAPLHRLTRYPLLLKNIWKKSNDAAEKVSIYSMKEKVESSIRDLEGRVKWLDKSQKFKQLQDVIGWPCLWERDKRFFIPEGLKHYFKDTNVETILSSPNRHLLYEGRLTMTESTRLLDVYLLLFDDFLLITKIKRNKRKSSNLEASTTYPSLHPELQTIVKEGGYCKVVDQPIPLDRLTVKSIDLFHVTVYGMKHAFLIQHENRYQQCIAAFIFQANTESAKKMWISQIETAISCYSEAYESNRTSLFGHPVESAEI